MKWLKRLLVLAMITTVLTPSLPYSLILAYDSWGLSDWSYRKKLTFDNTASAEDLEYFPVLVHLDSTNINWDKVQDSGQDIRFTDSDGITELDYEIEFWDDTNEAWIWVEVPKIEAGVDTDYIYMYYGNPLAPDGQNIAGTWNDNYVAVYHMNDVTTTTIADSTANANTGTKPFVPGDVPIDSCDSTTNWAGTSLSNDTADKQEGTGSLMDTIASPVAATNYDTVYTPLSPLNLGARQIDFWFKCDRASTAFTATQIIITDGAYTQTTSIGTYAANTWTRVWITLSASLNQAAITGITFRTTAADTTAFTKKIDIVYANGSSVEVAGTIGKAQDFEGSNDYINCGAGASLDITGAVMVEAFAYPEAEGNLLITSKYGYNRCYQLSFQSAAGPTFLIRDANAKTAWRVGTVVGINNQYYLAGTYDQTDQNGIHIFINGSNADRLLYGTCSGDIESSPTAALIIGAGGTLRFNGPMDEVRISNIARSADWVEAQYLSMTGAFITYGQEKYYIAPAESTIQVVAVPYLGEGILSFAAILVSDKQVDLSWTKGENIVNVMVRAKYSEMPMSRTDGYLVYEGSLGKISDTSMNFDESTSILYYRIWAQNSEGVWLDSEVNTQGVEGIIVLVLGFLGVACFFTWFSHRRRDLLISMVSGLLWFALAMWFFFSEAPVMGVDETWKDILAWVFVIMVFVPFLLQMNVEIKHESGGHSWSSWGEEPSRKSSAYEDYREKLFNRTRRRR